MDLADIFSGSVTPAKWQALGEYLESTGVITGPGLRTRKVGNKTILTTRRRGTGGGGDNLPFHVSLFITAGPPKTYEVTIDWGYVNEIIPGDGDAMMNHEPENRLDGDNAAKFSITSGQAVYVRCEVNEDGMIATESESGAVTISIDADLAESVHYVPKVDTENSEGTVGYLMYKLAVLTVVDDVAKLEKFLTGSHINYSPALPAIKTASPAAADVGVIPKEYNNGEKAYKLRAIKGLCGIKVEQTSTEIELSPKGDTFRVRIWEATITGETDGLYVTIDVDAGTAPSQEFWVLKGIWYTTEPETWTDCGGGEESPVYDVSWVLPTMGGPGV